MKNETSGSAVEYVKATLRQLDLDQGGSQWVGRVGDLVVVDNDRVSLSSPSNWRLGGLPYSVPPGRHEVYAAAYDFGGFESPHFRVFQLFLRFVPWEQLVDANWDGPGSGSLGTQVEDCACLWTDRSEEAARRLWGYGEDEGISWIEDAVSSADVLAKPGNYPNHIVDPASGANILAFPIAEGFVDLFEARTDGGGLLAMILRVED